MTPSDFTYDLPSDAPRSVLREDGIEYGFIGTLQGLKYEYRRDITNRATLEKNFRDKFEALNRARLTDSEFARLLDDIVSNRDSTHYFANNNARHFAFNQDERFLPIYQFADEANKKITHLDDFAATFLQRFIHTSALAA